MKIDKYPNIILVVIDALRASNLGCYGMNGNQTPNIDRLTTQKGVLFDNAYACWNTTDQSLTSILTGKYPRSHGIMNHGDKVTSDDRQWYINTGTKSLAQILQQHGYKTMAVDWMDRWFINGFNYYGYEINRTFLEKIGYYFIDLPKLYLKYMVGHLPILKCYTPMRKPTLKDMTKGFKDVISTFAFTFNLAKLHDAAFITSVAKGLINQNNHKPFFLFLHYWDTHTPYHCPNDYIDNDKKIHDSKELLIAKYNGAVRYVDSQLGELFTALKKGNLWDNTFLIITSDHGDSLIEHDIFFDHHGLYEETTHVPLIFNFPSLFTQARRVDGLVQHIDIAPTICDILNIDNYSYNFDGVSLIKLIQNKVDEIRDHVFIEESYVQKKMAFRTKKYKYISALDNDGWCNYCQKIHVGKEELYNLEIDPNENHDIAPQNESLAQKMKIQLDDIVDYLDRKREDTILRNNYSTRNDSEDYTLEDEEKIVKRMRNLGYF